jgi:hypothetical protein
MEGKKYQHDKTIGTFLAKTIEPFGAFVALFSGIVFSEYCPSNFSQHGLVG